MYAASRTLPNGRRDNEARSSESITESGRRRHAEGALLGLAVGDALGTTNEFADLDAPPFPTLATGPHASMAGGGPFRVAPGQVTDDTQMATALWASLVATGGFDLKDVARRYVAWTKYAFDIGHQTGAALRLVARGTSPSESGRKVWESRGRQPAANGSLMRTAPIAVFFAADAKGRRAASLGDSAITHFDPRCQLACASFDAAIAQCCIGAPDVPAIFDVARAEIDAAARSLGNESAAGSSVQDAREALHADLVAAEANDPELYGATLHLHGHAGFVRVAFRLAFWELAHAPTFEAALVDAVNRGGDADTNGAITGALLGAYHGRDAIPREWIDAVLSALQGKDGPLATTYHPRVLLASTATREDAAN
ncbi:MAG: ADP-ribosylglycohydrolase family protein [Chloroflexota bacterium]|nr:ADP-ribosylglycohydrolase family protein [Chloroflexota bacterium]